MYGWSPRKPFELKRTLTYGTTYLKSVVGPLEEKTDLQKSPNHQSRAAGEVGGVIRPVKVHNFWVDGDTK